MNVLDKFALNFETSWQRTDQLFQMLDDRLIYTKTIDLRNPFIFYLGHLPGFSHIQLRKTLPELFPLISQQLDEVFERGIDPDCDDPTQCHDHSVIPSQWPARLEVQAYRDQIREQIRAALRSYPQSLQDENESQVFCQNLRASDCFESFMRSRQRILNFVLEHEQMHQETMLYMLQHMRLEDKVTLGRELDAEAEFGWDNEFPSLSVHVDEFELSAFPVTCGEYCSFVQAGGYSDRSLWEDVDWVWKENQKLQHPVTWRPTLDSFDIVTVHSQVPLRSVLAWPVYVSLAEAKAYTQWRARADKQAYRIASEPETHHAMWSFLGPTPDSKQCTLPQQTRLGYSPASSHRGREETMGNYDFTHWAPTPVTLYPPNALGLYDMIGNGWEWTSTVFAGLPGFTNWIQSYPGYSQDLFDGKHYVVLGAGFGTDRQLVRPSFRNWYQARYPHMHAKFRLAKA